MNEENLAEKLLRSFHNGRFKTELPPIEIQMEELDRFFNTQFNKTFKVGDIVRLVKNPPYNCPVEGQIGLVVDVFMPGVQFETASSGTPLDVSPVALLIKRGETFCVFQVSGIYLEFLTNILN